MTELRGKEGVLRDRGKSCEVTLEPLPFKDQQSTVLIDHSLESFDSPLHCTPLLPSLKALTSSRAPPKAREVTGFDVSQTLRSESFRDPGLVYLGTILLPGSGRIGILFPRALFKDTSYLLPSNTTPRMILLPHSVRAESCS